MIFVRVVVKNLTCVGVGFLLFYFVGTDCKSALSGLAYNGKRIGEVVDKLDEKFNLART